MEGFLELRGKVALVTGGARRLGREIAVALGAGGARVMVHYHTAESEARELVATFANQGIEAASFTADLAGAAAAVALIDATIERFGGLDILVNNASRFERRPFLEVTVEEWDRVLAVNLRAPFLLAQHAAPHMRRRGQGKIVNLGDLAGLRPWPAYPHHSVSKAGLRMLTEVAARALAPEIQVNAIAPGTVLPPSDFDARELFPGEAQALAGLIAKTPAGRQGSPSDVVEAVLYLIRADYVTGTTLVVDGGRSLV